MKLLIVAALALLVSGCSVTRHENDPALERVIFKECMASLPAGPASTVYNDWDEVVAECRTTAFRQSLVCVQGCTHIVQKP